MYRVLPVRNELATLQKISKSDYDKLSDERFLNSSKENKKVDKNYFPEIEFNKVIYSGLFNSDTNVNVAKREQRIVVTPNPTTADADDNFGFNEVHSFFQDADSFDPDSGTDKDN